MTDSPVNYKAKRGLHYVNKSGKEVRAEVGEALLNPTDSSVEVLMRMEALEVVKVRKVKKETK